MTRRRFAHGSVAVVIGLALSASAVTVTAPAYAEGTPEIVLPATMRTTPRKVYLESAGASGFLQYRTGAQGSGLWWIGYDGSGEPVEGGEKQQSRGAGYHGTGSDVVALPPDQRGGGQVLLRDMGTGATETVTLPADQYYLQTYGRTVLAYSLTGTDRTELSLLRAGNGGTVTRPVTGLPEGSDFPFLPEGSASGIVVRFYGPEDRTLRAAWVDPETGAATILPPELASTDTVVGPGYLAAWNGPTQVRVYTPGAWDTPVREVRVLRVANIQLLGIVGDAVVTGRRDGTGLTDVTAVPFDGSAARPLLKRAAATFLTAPDGGLVVTGGESAEDYGIARIEAGPDGLPGVRRIVDVPPRPMGVESLDLSGGELLTYESGDGATHLYSRSLTTVGTLAAGPRTDRGKTWHCGVLDGDSGSCPTLLGTGDGRAVTLDALGDVSVLERGTSLPGTVLASGLRDNDDLAGAAGRYAAWTGPTPQGDGLSVVDLDTGKPVRTFTGAAARSTSVALWGETLWTATGDGTVTATEVRSGTAITSFHAPAGCATGNVEAVGRWVYWSGTCDLPQGGSARKAVVYDTRGKTLVAVPAAADSRLGDGFVVSPDPSSGALVLTDVSRGSAVSRTLAAKAGPWDVDPYTGLVGYVDSATQDIHVVRGGVPATDLAVLGAKAAASVGLVSPSSAWDGTWWLSRPAASWTLAFRNKATGATVRTLSGGAATDAVHASWNGRTSSGAYVPNGTYTWTLTVVPADGRGAAATSSGSLRLTGGAAVRRDQIGSDGTGDLLTLNSTGGLTFHRGDGAGAFGAKTSGSGWSASIKAVPFGDLSGDRCNDLLVRSPGGELRAYRPACGAAVKPSTASTSLGTGWNQYDVLTSPGDVSGDGRADLIARQSSTGDVYLYTATSTGKLSARVKIASRWTGYKKIVGAGDLDGDGHGDLLVQDRSNELWRYGGAGSGKFRGRVKVADDWGTSYDTVVGVGDITGDGRADLVSRDSSGSVWRNNGNGKGSFGGRTRIATGWQAYKGLF
ncbi:FG-GAP-like repeat-containing protein [Streptomyces sp. NPDC002176]|uniref:FG-GAP-like repeat-containing protein n=1 Tax=Streptomyces sp. NPDC002176 TaxID=3364634 RepID=UPI003850AC00